MTRRDANTVFLTAALLAAAPALAGEEGGAIALPRPQARAGALF